MVMMAFRPVDDYTTFRAEFSVSEGDIIFHFFKTKEVEALPNVRDYWAKTFAEVLEPAAKKHFRADYPRLKAQHCYDEESPYSRQEPLDSWWFRAYGFGHLLDAHGFALKFLESLDAGLEEALKRSRT